MAVETKKVIRPVHPPFLTVSEVADLARVTEVSVRRWLMTGALRGTKFGGVTRISLDDLQAFMSASGTSSESIGRV